MKSLAHARDRTASENIEYGISRTVGYVALLAAVGFVVSLIV
ncbi:hypothetical protein ACH0CP_13740 [Sphingomonas sp. 179-I 2A4 NHS]